jgi:glycine/D-amino acid oxidase-like deaminating enzyme
VNDLPRAADVVIIGAGFAGAATAWALARRGVRDVLVLERETELGRFASGRSAGLGRQLAEDDDTTALTVRGAALLRELPGVWQETGGFLGFDRSDHIEAYLARAEKFRVPVERVERRAVIDRWPELGAVSFYRALHVPTDGAIDIVRLLAALVEPARVVLGVGVSGVERGRVITSRGEIAARVVVDASGAWAGSVTGDPPLEALKRHIVVFEASPRPTAPWMWHLGAGELYVRATAEGILASPCDAAACAPGHQDPDPSAEALLRDLLGTSPRITRRWACQRTFTPDRRMRLGADPSRPWLVWAVGLGGHGATAAPAVGERVADDVVRALT